MTHAPIGSSSGLLNAVDTRHAPRRLREWLAPVTGLSTSLLLHGAILVAGVLLIREIPRILPTHTEQPAPTGFQINDTPNPLAANPFETGKNPLDTARQSRGMDHGSLEPASGRSAMDEVTGVKQLDASSLAIGTGKNTISGINGIGSYDKGDGIQIGTRTGGDGPISFIPGDPTGGPHASRVVFLCDGTGTMLGLKFDLLRRELASTIGSLKPVQNFNIILFADEGARAMSKTLAPGTPASRRQADEFLRKFSPGGATNPIPGIEMAFSMKPQVIFLLSDGEFDNLVAYSDVIAKIKALNPNKQVKVYTILFGDRDDRAQQTLQTIASENGGTFRFVKPEDLLNR